MNKRYFAGNRVNVHGPFDDVIWHDMDYDAICVVKNNLKGCVFSDGSSISCSYDDIGPCHDGSLFVNLKGEWLLIDKSETVIQRFGKIKAYPLLSLLVVCENDKWGAINKSGEYVIPVEYISILQSLRAGRIGKLFPILVLEDSERRIILADSYGKILTSRKYGREIGTSSVTTDTFHNECLNGLINLLDEDNREDIVMFNCYSQRELNEYVPGQKVSDLDEVLRLGGHAFLLHYDGKKQLMDSNGKVIVPFDRGYQDFGKVWRMKGEYLFPALKDGKWGYLNEFGKEKIKCQYDIANPFYHGLAIVGYIDKSTCKHLLGIIDRHDNIKIPFAYSEIKEFGYKGDRLFIRAKKSNSDTFKVYGYDGCEYETPGSYTFKLDDTVYTFCCGRVVTVDERDNELYNNCYDDTWTIKSINGKYGICDEANHYVVNPIFDCIVERNGIYCGDLGDMKYTITKKYGTRRIK